MKTCNYGPCEQEDAHRDELLTILTKYQELIYAVARKWPGESRHETALRYIRQSEVLCSGDGGQKEAT